MRLRQPATRVLAATPVAAGRARSARTGRVRRVSEIVSFGLVGLTVGAALIVAVHHAGNRGGARNTVAAASFTAIAAPIPVLQTKEDPLIPPSALRQAALVPADLPGGAPLVTQVVARAGKGDMMVRPLLDDMRRAAVPPAAPGTTLAARLLPSPPVWKLEKSWRLARLERARVLERRKKRLRELTCLAKAIYFEARSESLKGQMAVAKVVLNRVRDPRFPNTICGVVYQGAERRNACQFSFACDGKPDYPTEMRHWASAKKLAAKAMRGQIRMRRLDGVAFYHADYVRPTWASMMRPVVKIGRHIFYRDS